MSGAWLLVVRSNGGRVLDLSHVDRNAMNQELEHHNETNTGAFGSKRNWTPEEWAA